jgi:hypothetical protein
VDAMSTAPRRQGHFVIFVECEELSLFMAMIGANVMI